MRLPGYDYSQPGWYFVTICTKNRREVFGVIKNGQMVVNQCGKIVVEVWWDLPRHYACILDAFVIMPNHVHGIINIPDRMYIPHHIVAEELHHHNAAAGLRPAAARREGDGVLHASLIEIIRALKSFSARRINELQKTQGRSVWQRSFHEHILRGEYDILSVREYIRLNPQKWDQDRNNLNRNGLLLKY